MKDDAQSVINKKIMELNLTIEKLERQIVEGNRMKESYTASVERKEQEIKILKRLVEIIGKEYGRED